MVQRKRNHLFCTRGIIYDPLAAGESSGPETKKINCTVFGRRRVICAFVIPTGGRNLLVAGTMALQATADSSTAAPFRNDKNAGICSGFLLERHASDA
jgi:hypothetical protein